MVHHDNVMTAVRNVAVNIIADVADAGVADGNAR